MVYFDYVIHQKRHRAPINVIITLLRSHHVILTKKDFIIGEFILFLNLNIWINIYYKKKTTKVIRRTRLSYFCCYRITRKNIRCRFYFALVMIWRNKTETSVSSVIYIFYNFSLIVLVVMTAAKKLKMILNFAPFQFLMVNCLKLFNNSVMCPLLECLIFQLLLVSLIT